MKLVLKEHTLIPEIDLWNRLDDRLMEYETIDGCVVEVQII